MARQNINIGTSANKGDGEPLRTAFDKINDNFTELYNTVIGDSKGSVFGDDSTLLVDAVNSTIPATNLSGALPALDGSALTNISVSSIDFANVTNTPTTIAGYGITDAFDGAFSSLSTTPTTIAGYGITDAFDGDYNSLSNQPTIPTASTDLSDTSSITLNDAPQTLTNKTLTNPIISLIQSSGSILTLDHGVNELRIKNGGQNYLTLQQNNSNARFIAEPDKQFQFVGSDGGTTITALTIDIAEAGNAIFNNNVTVGNDLVVTGNLTSTTGTLALGGNSISGVDNIAAGTLNTHTIPGGAAGTLALIGDVVVTETDPVVGAVNGIVKADGAGNISAAVAGTDYLVVETIDLATLKGEVAASADFADFKTRIAAL